MKPLRNGMLTIAALALAGIFFLALAPIALASNTWYVDGVSGSDSNTCMSSESACKTIGHAISLASSGDSIIVAAATYTENLTIGISLKILGSGANQTVIDGGGKGRVLNISNGNVTLFGVTIRNGVAQYGAGIFNGGTLSVIASTISGNNAKAPYCLYERICSGAAGAGILNGGTLTISSSAVVNNSAQGTFPNCVIGRNCPVHGGGIYNGGKMIMTDSTLANNTAYSASGGTFGSGGGIFNQGSAVISSGTVSRNSSFVGGGIYTSGTITLQNSIVADSSYGNCYGTMTSNGYNLSSDGTCNFNSRGDLNNHDPLLGALQNNGGPTDTMALLPGSPAIDAGNPSGCSDAQGNLLKTDQRGMPRPDKEDASGCDMGAYESQGD